MFKLSGVVPPMITPFDRGGNLDLSGLETLLDYLKERVHGLYICGSYGSGPLMSVEERKKVAEVAVKVVNGRIPVIVHSGTANTRDTVALTRHALEIGCAGAAAVGPYYYHHNDDGVLAFYTAMLEAVPGDFPVYLYHNPKFSGYSVSLEVIEKLRKKGLHGIKDATFDILTFATYMRELATAGMDIVLGTEAMWLSARALGAEAYIPGLGNAFPEICSRMWEQGMADDLDGCRRTQFKVNKLRDIMYLARSTQLAVYAMLEIRGVVTAYPRSPFVPAGLQEKQRIEKALAELGVL
jgi:dihydrodipicolinate synthase/N-acetylneuraminate lyase